MPTGYTASVQDGTTTEFREFAMQCARAFGALVMMRDEPMDADIPSEFEPSTDYHDDLIGKAKAELLRIEGMSDTECYAAAKAEREQWWAAFEDRKQSRDRTRERYETMLSEAQAWEPPTDEHRGLKDFMVKQLTESIDFDCSSEYDKPGPFLDGPDWRREKIRKARRDIEYHTKQRGEEIERARSRSEWVKQLRRSLPASSEDSGDIFPPCTSPNCALNGGHEGDHWPVCDHTEKVKQNAIGIDRICRVCGWEMPVMQEDA